MKNTGEKLMCKKNFIFLFLIFVTFVAFSEEYYTGKMLIFGWTFEKSDTTLQNNLAVDSILNYVSAAKYQMTSSERYNPSCRIGLYQNVFEHNRAYPAVYVYINREILDDYFYRHIEIDFYVAQDAVKYKLILNSNDDYEWSENSIEKDSWELVYKNETAYDIFVSWMETLRK
jgi:hypothetical protein